MPHAENNTWLCRNCNTLVSSELNICPSCKALHPKDEYADEPTPEGVAQEIVVENYANTTPETKSKYNFRESILTTFADIFLALGMLLVVGVLIAPMFIELPYSDYTVTLASACIAVALGAVVLTTWALLRTVADISRRTREMHEHK